MGGCLQAATCGRCRAELGEAGRVCRHCRMDDVWIGWETRLFRLEARAMGAGGYVSHEDAVRQVRRLQPDQKQPRARHCMSALLEERARGMCGPLHIHDCQREHVQHGMQAQAASLRRITQGGLDEASILYAEGLAGNSGEAGRRSAAA